MDEDDRADLVSALFALLTARLEDAASLAAEGQGGIPTVSKLELAHGVAAIADQVRTVAMAIEALFRDQSM